MQVFALSERAYDSKDRVWTNIYQIVGIYSTYEEAAEKAKLVADRAILSNYFEYIEEYFDDAFVNRAGYDDFVDYMEECLLIHAEGLKIEWPNYSENNYLDRNFLTDFATVYNVMPRSMRDSVLEMFRFKFHEIQEFTLVSPPGEK